MKTSTSVALWVLRITGALQVILGVLFWTGNAAALVPVHMISGSILVIALWFLGFQAIQSGANPALGTISIVWGLLTVALGMTQTGILPGPYHWVIQVLHLLVGIVAMGLGNNVAVNTARRAERTAA